MAAKEVLVGKKPGLMLQSLKTFSFPFEFCVSISRLNYKLQFNFLMQKLIIQEKPWNTIGNIQGNSFCKLQKQSFVWNK